MLPDTICLIPGSLGTRPSGHQASGKERYGEYMAREDTIRLLRECNAGVKTGTISLERVSALVKNKDLQKLLLDSLKDHEKLGDEAHTLLNSYDTNEKDPHACVRMMCKCKIAMKMKMSPKDGTGAALIHDGCNMGIRSLCKYLNQYPTADQEAKNLTQRLIDLETDLMMKLRPYL